MRPFVFLGGTVGHSHWREPFTQRLIEMGVAAARIYNPVVEEWTVEDQAREDRAKHETEHVLFYICNPESSSEAISSYSLVEATMHLYDRPESTVVVFDINGVQGHSLKSLRKCEKDLRERFPNGHIYSTGAEALGYFERVLSAGGN